ncbi:MAG: hypothetical protein ACE5D3_08970 [Candidatus Binatia bacterium]
MSQFWHIFFAYVHVLGIVLFVGPQFFLGLAWVPASRQITDQHSRARAMRTVTRRFLYIGGAGLLLAIVAGSYLIATWRSYYGVPEGVSFTSLRFGVVFIIKMALLLVMLVAVAAHTFWLGPRLLAATEEAAQGSSGAEAKLRDLRLRSMLLSLVGLGLALAMMVMGVLLNTTQWSLR